MEPNIARILLNNDSKDNKVGKTPVAPYQLEPTVMVDMFPGPALLVDGNMVPLYHNIFAKTLLEALDTGEVFLKNIISRCLSNGCPDAQKITLNHNDGLHHYDLYAFPLKSTLKPIQSQNVAEVLLFGRETTIEHNLTNALVDSRQMFKDLVSCSTDFAWETDCKGNFIYASPKGILGYSSFELNGKNSRDMIIGNSGSNPFETTDRITETELWLTQADGSMACLLVSAVPIQDDHANWKGARGICRDISHIREREAIIRRSHKREHILNQIVATIRDMVNPADMLKNALSATLEGIEAACCCIIQKTSHEDGHFTAKIKLQQGCPITENMMTTLCQKLLEIWSCPLPRPPRTQNLQINNHQILMGLTRHHGADNGAIFLIRDQVAPWHEDEIYLFDGITTHLGIAVEQLITHEELERRAFADDLTGLLNRRAFGKEIIKRLHNQKRSRKTGALLYLDLDNFKNVNDSKGHAHGDMILKQLARIIQDNIRVGDYGARLGGDEFSIWLDEISEQEALTKANDFVAAGSELSQLADVEGPQLSLSIGVAMSLPGDKQTYDDLIRKADDALYQVKAAGKSACLLHKPVKGKDHPDA